MCWLWPLWSEEGKIIYCKEGQGEHYRCSLLFPSSPPLLRRLMCYDLVGLFLSCIFSGKKPRWFTVTQPSDICVAQVASNIQELRYHMNRSASAGNAKCHRLKYHLSQWIVSHSCFWNAVVSTETKQLKSLNQMKDPASVFTVQEAAQLYFMLAHFLFQESTYHHSQMRNHTLNHEFNV